MNELGTISQDFATPYLDKMHERSRNQKVKNRKPFHGRKVPFEPDARWKKCAAGREEIG